MVLGNSALGDAIVAYHIAHWDELGVEYVIWQQRMLSSPNGCLEADGEPREPHGQPHGPPARELPGLSSARPQLPHDHALRAVLFDMDGTLVETEQYWGEAMFELAAPWAAGCPTSARAATVGHVACGWR